MLHVVSYLMLLVLCALQSANKKQSNKLFVLKFRCICILLFTVAALVLNISSLSLLFQITSSENGLFSVSLLPGTVKPQGY